MTDLIRTTCSLALIGGALVFPLAAAGQAKGGVDRTVLPIAEPKPSLLARRLTMERMP